MARVRIIGTRARLDATVAELHRLGVLHVVDASAAPAVRPLGLEEDRARLQNGLAFLSARVDALLHVLPPTGNTARAADWEAPRDARALADDLRSRLDRLAPAIQELAQRRDARRAESDSLPHYETTLRLLAPLAVELPELADFDTAALLIDRRYRDALALIRLEVERITGGRCELITRDVAEHTTAALLVYPRVLGADVQAALGQQNITQVRLPKELAGRTFRDALAALLHRQATLRAELERIEAELYDAATRWRATLEAWQREMRNRQTELAIHTRCGATTYAFVMEGWVPRRALERVRQALAAEAGSQVILEELAVGSDDRARAPVAFDNPAPMRPFEILVRTMAVPRYGTFDPTPVLAIFLPLFFGIMLGDVAYGALLLLAAWYVRRRVRRPAVVQDVAQVLIYGALWAILFGFLYGEFLGTLGHGLGLRPLWIPREGEQILALFGFSLGLGAVQVVMGLLLGAWQAWRERQRSELVAKAGMLLALTAIFGMVGILTEFLPRDFFTPTVAALLVGVVLLSAPSGVLGILLGPLEVLETLGNILSYLRLAAIGLSSVYLALVANEMGGMVGNLLVGGVLALLLHALNFALGVFSPTIQSLRLHYVEFFRQFYQGGGEEYQPFRMQ